MAILTKPLNGRAACHYCAQCGRGCITASNFSSSQVMIPPAQATGRFTLITGAMAREIVVGKDGKAESVAYIDKATRSEKRVHARAFMVAASACESARLLLNSRSTLFPDGLANSSGALGRYLTDSVGSFGWRIFSATGKNACPQSRRHRRYAHVHAVVEIRPQERFPPRIPHRVRRRQRTCPVSATLTDSATTTKATARRSSSMPNPVRHLHRFRWPRRDDSQRKKLLRH